MEVTRPPPLVWSLRAKDRIPPPARKDLFSRSVILLADSMRQAQARLRRLERPISGVVVVPGRRVAWHRESERLWSLVTPPATEKALLKAAGFVTGLLDRLETQRNEARRHQAELEYLQRDIFQARQDYAVTVERLQSRVQEAAMMSRLLGEIQGKERMAIGREMHDELGQNLTAIRLKIFSMKKGLSRHNQKQAGELDSLLELTDHVAAWIRDLVHRLNPARPEGVGLLRMLDDLAARFSRKFRIQAKLKYQLEEPILDGVAEEQLYFIAQEAMHNAVRHARATRITVTVKPGRGRQAQMIVENNGGPFAPPAGESGLGLSIMRQRAELLNGTVGITARPRGGARLSCRFALFDGMSAQAKRPGQVMPCRFCRFSPCLPEGPHELG